MGKLKLTTKIRMGFLLLATIPLITIGSISLAVYQESHESSLDANETAFISEAEKYLNSFSEQKAQYYDREFDSFRDMTLYDIAYLNNVFSHRENYGNFTTQWDDLNETGTLTLDEDSASCVHLAINSTNSIKVNESGSFLVSIIDEETNETDYFTTSTPYTINSTLNNTIYMTAPLDVLWNSTTSENELLRFSYFGSKYGMHRSLPWHWMNETN